MWKRHSTESSGEPLSPSSETWRQALKLYPNSPWALSGCDFIAPVTIYCPYFLWMPFYSEVILYLLPTRIFLHLLWQVWALLGQAHDSLTKAFLGLCDDAGSAWCLGSLWTTPSQSLMYGPTSTGFQYLHQALQMASRTNQQWLFDCGCSEIQRTAFPRRHSATPFGLHTKEGRFKFGKNNSTKLRKQIFKMYLFNVLFKMYVFYRVICRHLKTKD